MAAENKVCTYWLFFFFLFLWEMVEVLFFCTSHSWLDEKVLVLTHSEGRSCGF